VEHPERETLLAYSKGQLLPDADEEVATHLEACSGECLTYLDSLPNNVQAAMAAVMRRAARRWR
jgi:anti-sigma factor ChrR (cupin superfamily)